MSIPIPNSIEAYQQYVRERLMRLIPHLQNCALGNFEDAIELPPPEDEFFALTDQIRLMAAALRQMNHLNTRRTEEVTASARRKQLQADLEKSQNRLARILLAVNDGIWDWDLLTNEVYFDPNYYRMAGYAVDAFPHQFEEFQQRVHPDDIDLVLDAAQRYVTGQSEHFTVEFRFRKQNGGWLWVMGRGVIVARDAAGNPTRFLGTHTNISRRVEVEKRLEGLLQIKDDLLQTNLLSVKLQGIVARAIEILDAGLVQIWTCDPDHCDLNCQRTEAAHQPPFDGACLQLAASVNQFSNSKDVAAIPVECDKKIFTRLIARGTASWDMWDTSQPSFAADFNWAAALGFQSISTYKIKSLDGGMLGIFMVSSPHQLNSFDIDFCKTVARIIAQSILLERSMLAIRDSEKRLRLALKAGNLGWYDLNIQTGAAQVNDAYARMLGYAPDRFVETNTFWQARLHPDDAASVGQQYADYIAGKTPEYRVEFRQKMQDGRWKWILSMGEIVEWDADGKPLRMLGTHTDIDDMKQVEQELTLQSQALQQSNQKLERFNRIAIGREHRMIELKQQINQLTSELGQEPPYDLSFLP